MSSQRLIEKQNVTCGTNMSKSFNLPNNSRLRNSRLTVSMKYLVQRQTKGKDDVSYIPGPFSSKAMPDSEVNAPVIVNDNVMFISDDDVKEFIALKGF